MRKALQWPARRIIENAGKDASVIVGKLLDRNDVAWGYDAQADRYVDMIEAGIIDPTKVVCTALQDAASVADLMITTEAMVAEKTDKKDGTFTGAPDMGAMDDMGF